MEFAALEEQYKYGYAHDDSDFRFNNYAGNPLLKAGDKPIEHDGRGKASAPSLGKGLDTQLATPTTTNSGDCKSEHEEPK